jgi:hypothetical protein
MRDQRSVATFSTALLKIGSQESAERRSLVLLPFTCPFPSVAFWSGQCRRLLDSQWSAGSDRRQGEDSFHPFTSAILTISEIHTSDSPSKLDLLKRVQLVLDIHTQVKSEVLCRGALLERHCWESIIHTEPCNKNTSGEPTTILDSPGEGRINRPDHLVLGRTWRASRRGDYKCVVVNRGVLATLFLSIPSGLIFSLKFF